ncbi:MAG: hypothetical protein RSE15_10920 [Flavobacterium sp.]|jgi:transposase|uniref:hypothetical protein n=1 Tax=Flavobacterium sp. TaxID=239 RepID=UPI00297577AD|nr:hypothetical protein [Flavobacterium sp.]TAF09704.1 MAG: hypothetical protein EAZ75_07215 [Flavobacteriia bacterium]WRH72862.1 MAG: hypothetical protein RSE15_10920 [Flavobacterium sp.]
MENIQENRSVKQTQKDYSMFLKFQIVQEIEQEKSTITQIRKQYGIQSHANVLIWLKKFSTFN